MGPSYLACWLLQSANFYAAEVLHKTLARQSGDPSTQTRFQIGRGNSSPAAETSFLVLTYCIMMTNMTLVLRIFAPSSTATKYLDLRFESKDDLDSVRSKVTWSLATLRATRTGMTGIATAMLQNREKTGSSPVLAMSVPSFANRQQVLNLDHLIE